MSAMSHVITGSFFCYPVPKFAAEFAEECCAVMEGAGFRRSMDPAWSAVAIAPCLREKLEPRQWSAPNHGTLIFHPSVLPYLRGPDAIRWAVEEQHPVSGVTWFWCDAGLDTGPVCAQLPVVLPVGMRAGEAYRELFVPAGVRALRSAVGEFMREGRWRRVPQSERGARYESYFPRERAREGNARADGAESGLHAGRAL